jgi:hypothetical protein
MKTYENLVKQTGIDFFPVNIPGIAEDCPFESFIFFVGGFALGGSYRNVFHFILCLPLEANPYIYMYIYMYGSFSKTGYPPVIKHGNGKFPNSMIFSSEKLPFNLQGMFNNLDDNLGSVP